MPYPKPYWSQILGSQSSGRSALGLATIAASGSYTDLINTPSLGSVASLNSIDLSSGQASGILAASRFPALSGDVTTASGSLSTTIAAGAVTLAKMANLPGDVIVGNNSGVAGVPVAMTVAQTKSLLAIAYSDVSGLGTAAQKAASFFQQSLAPTTKTTAYAAAVGDLVLCDTTSGGFTVTLPTSPTSGSLIGVKQIVRGGTNVVTLQCGGTDVFNVAGSPQAGTITLLNQGITLQYNAGSPGVWIAVSDDIPLSQTDLRYAQVATSNTFLASQYISSGGLTVGNASNPKGTGSQKLEVYGTGTGAPAFGSLALSRADGTNSTVVGSIDFYTVTTLAGQILCNQVAGGAGGTNYLSFNLGSAGTMTTPMQLQYASGSATGTLLLGLSNSTLQGKLSVYNYSNGAVTTGITLSNPVSTGGTGGCGLTWISSAGDSIGQIRGHYMAATGVGDVVIGVGTGATNGLQDFVRLTSGNVMQFYGLSSTASRRQGFISSTWNVSTDATRIGQVNIGATGIISGSETNQTAITIIPSTSGPTTTITGGFSVSGSGVAWSGTGISGASFSNGYGVCVMCVQQEIVTGGGLMCNAYQYAKASGSFGQANRNTYGYWFGGNGGHVNFPAVAALGSPALYARVRIDPDGFTSASAQTATLGATLYIGSAPASVANLTFTTSRALHVNAGESYFGGNFIVGTGNIHFNNGAPIARPTITGSKGSNAALASLLTALSNYGLIIDSTT